MAFQLNVNGRTVSVEAEPGTPLLWALRDGLGMTGVKFGCGVAACGACTVHLDGQPARACQTFVDDLDGVAITTIEGLAADQADSAARAVIAAWRELDVAQCGWCQSGQIMAATALLAENPRPSDADIDAAMDGNVCRCATYPRIRAAIHRAAATMEG
jgi:isoquinoline 1-oxidoreductase alpha subunit